MSLPTDTPAAGRRNWCAFAGWVWIALLVVGYVFAVYKCIPRDALDLGETAFTYTMLLGLPLAGFSLVTVIYLLVMGVSRLWAKHPDKWVPWIRLAVFFLCLVGIAKWPKTITTYNPITPASEPVYLALAAVAREALGGPKSERWISLDPNSGLYSNDKISADSRNRLEKLVPDYWPRSLLSLGIEEDCVVLDRGSGMLGSLGVRIYDRGPAILHSETALRENSYLPDQIRITDRVWYYRSD